MFSVGGKGSGGWAFAEILLLVCLKRIHSLSIAQILQENSKYFAQMREGDASLSPVPFMHICVLTGVC